MIKAFAKAYAASDETEDIVKSMHVMRRTLLKGVETTEANWGKALKAYVGRLPQWLREGRGGAIGQVVSLRSAAKLAPVFDDDVVVLGKVVTALCESPKVYPETLAVLEELEGVWALNGAKKAALSESAPFVAPVLLRLKFEFSSKATSLMVDSWVALLSREIPTDVAMLKFVTDKVLPRAGKKSLRFVDFYVSAAATQESPLAKVLALEGLYYLVAHHGLEYASLYDEMLAVVQNSPATILDPKHRTRFLDLVSQALASPYATTPIKVAFAGALADAACRGSPRGIIALLRALDDLIARCPDAVPTARPRILSLTTHYLPVVASTASQLLDRLGKDFVSDHSAVALDAFTYAHLYAAQPKLSALKSSHHLDDDPYLEEEEPASKRLRLFATAAGFKSRPKNDDAPRTLHGDLPFLAQECVDVVLRSSSSSSSSKRSSERN